jgi:hypothetical protein
MLAEIFILRLEAMLRALGTSRSGKELSVRSARRQCPYCPNRTRSHRFTKNTEAALKRAGTARPRHRPEPPGNLPAGSIQLGTRPGNWLTSLKALARLRPRRRSAK